MGRAGRSGPCQDPAPSAHACCRAQGTSSYVVEHMGRTNKAGGAAKTATGSDRPFQGGGAPPGSSRFAALPQAGQRPGAGFSIEAGGRACHDR